MSNKERQDKRLTNGGGVGEKQESPHKEERIKEGCLAKRKQKTIRKKAERKKRRGEGEG